ncbi:MAG: hypothetical protein A2X81_00555 [Desulfobacterales bacterium GWB2_56_26]|nr:MAG: hypothetical protein A2X81_00555 [Desulfobacterales bacterium GWB2_56_26]
MTVPASGFRIGLAATPWSIFNRPSLQLGVLKSYVEERLDARVDTFHLSLPVTAAIGVDRYARIARSGWAGEALFAPLLFPEMRVPAEKLFYTSLAGEKRSLASFSELVERVEESCTTWLSSLPTEDYHLFGFSVCFFQLLPSLYLAKLLKKTRPELPIVFGGSSCTGAVGASLIEHFPEIDYLVDGEGEEALCRLCRFIAGDATSLPTNVRSQRPIARAQNPAAGLEPDDLPCPDYSPYFQEMRKFFPELPFIPMLPVEFSRGCWWNTCTFCNLNLQWLDYRCKTGEKMAAEILHLARTHESLHFTFADNALPLREADLFFSKIAAAGLDLQFFAEIRAIAEPERLQLYRRGGLKTIQVGIEALSTSLLQKMAKGTTVIGIMATMKTCSETGIRLEGNIITEFPTTTETEIAETLAHLDYLFPFPPLQAARFFLGYGSPIHARAKEFSIRAVLPHAKNRRLFPRNLLRSMTLLTCGYRGDRRTQQRLWRPVHEKIRAWQEYHRQRNKDQPYPLSYEDGRTFLIIRQERPAGAPLLHRLRGLSRDVYLFCRRPQKRADISREFPAVSARNLENFFAEMSTKRLMFIEGDLALSLAVRAVRR